MADLRQQAKTAPRPDSLEGLINMMLASQAEALFISNLQPSDQPSAVQIAAAIRASLRQHGGTSGCAGACASEYGEHPDTAPGRMRWALTTIAQASAPLARAA
jgi:hypothetical protein